MNLIIRCLNQLKIWLDSDEFKEQLFKSVGLPLSRFHGQSSYSAKEIGKTIAVHLKQFTDTK